MAEEEEIAHSRLIPNKFKIYNLETIRRYLKVACQKKIAQVEKKMYHYWGLPTWRPNFVITDQTYYGHYKINAKTYNIFHSE